MNLKIKTFVLLIFPVLTYGQLIYTGEVTDKLTKQKIPFATIGLIKENRGTNADENGKFNLGLKKYMDDTLIISCAGYETTKFPVNDLPPESKFEISEKQIVLKTIIVNNNYKTLTALNYFSNCGMNFYTSEGSITQVAQHLQSPVMNALLNEINICKAGDNSWFRIRVYDIDSVSGKPSADLADTIIEVKSGKRHVHIDMAPYKIIIPGKDFFVAVEWLYIPYNADKTRSRRDGKKIVYNQYSPYISIKKPIDNNSSENTLEAWLLDYRKKWIHTYQNWTMLISATVKY